MANRNFWIGVVVILIVATGIWGLYQSYQDRVRVTDRQFSSPAPTPIEKFPDADTSPSPTSAGTTLPATGVTPQTLPATGGN